MFDNILEILVDTMPYSVWLRDIDGKFIFVNKYFCDSLDLRKNELIGKNTYEIYGDELGKEYEENYNIVKNLKEPKLFKGYQNDKFLECYIAPIKKENKVVAFMGILQEKTERNKYEVEIIKQKALLKTLIDTIPDSIFYKNVNGTYLDCNIAFARDYYTSKKTS